MNVTLLSTDQRMPTRRFAIGDQPIVIGRSSHADVHVADPWVSRFHCDLRDIEGTAVVRDLGSRHGTFINGQPVQEAFLVPGDRLSLGVTSFEVQYDRSADAADVGSAVLPSDCAESAYCASANSNSASHR